MKNVLRMALVLPLVYTVAAQAEIYRWTDAYGQVHFTDAPPPNKGKKVDVKIAPPSRTPDDGERRRLALVEAVKVKTEHDAEMKKLTDAVDAKSTTKEAVSMRLGCAPSAAWFTRPI